MDLNSTGDFIAIVPVIPCNLDELKAVGKCPRESEHLIPNFSCARWKTRALRMHKLVKKRRRKTKSKPNFIKRRKYKKLGCDHYDSKSDDLSCHPEIEISPDVDEFQDRNERVENLNNELTENSDKYAHKTNVQLTHHNCVRTDNDKIDALESGVASPKQKPKKKKLAKKVKKGAWKAAISTWKYLRIGLMNLYPTLHTPLDADAWTRAYYHSSSRRNNHYQDGFAYKSTSV